MEPRVGGAHARRCVGGGVGEGWKGWWGGEGEKDGKGGSATPYET